MTLPVGLAAARNGVPGHLPHRRIADRGLAVSVAGIPLFPAGRRGEAPLRRSDVARPDGARISLLDAAAADPACVVRGATAAVAAGRRERPRRSSSSSDASSSSSCRGARGRSRLRAVAVPGADPADRQLQFLQPAQHVDVHLPLRRRGAAPAASAAARSAGAEHARRIRGASATTVATVLALVVVPVGVNRISAGRHAHRPAGARGSFQVGIAAAASSTAYGLFAVMTTARPEIVIEGSRGRRRPGASTGSATSPGRLTRAPFWNIPHQPRLDWQMWFAALGDVRQIPGFASCSRLLEGSPPVLALLGSNPFPDRPPDLCAPSCTTIASPTGAPTPRPVSGGRVSSRDPTFRRSVWPTSNALPVSEPAGR